MDPEYLMQSAVLNFSWAATLIRDVLSSSVFTWFQLRPLTISLIAFTEMLYVFEIEVLDSPSL